jgi:hypothetical protein
MAVNAAVVEFLLSQVRTSNEGALVNGTVYFYEPGTTTLKNIFQDEAKTIPAANPYTLDADATAQIFAYGAYRVVVKDENGVIQYDRDNLRFSISDEALVSDAAYSGAWDGDTTHSPSKNAAYDKINAMISNTAYGSSWSAVTTITPSKKVIYDKIQTLGTAAYQNISYFDVAGSSVSDTAYGASWASVTTIAPSKKAVYDKIENLAVSTIAPLRTYNLYDNGTNTTIDWNNGNFQKVTVASTALTFVAPTAGVCILHLDVTLTNNLSPTFVTSINWNYSFRTGYNPWFGIYNDFSPGNAGQIYRFTFYWDGAQYICENYQYSFNGLG